MTDSWAVKLLPSGATNSVPEGEQAAHRLAQRMVVTDGTTAAEVLHLGDDGVWEMMCRYSPADIGPGGRLLSSSTLKEDPRRKTPWREMPPRDRIEDKVMTVPKN